ncbi:23S rRNA (uracil(1939)-C(5))-methyltransferase RlmD [Gloeothece verrucosa]|uniref:RNA methyltransferase, TrmA family n=1 Tax=Gloeothece verrucosa (strain PCC 7822) TaxID=497965 RepID=E0U629_GLOV7|nr:23S rRNA (uracil(1939)-C(5))-methyltransferase RlmD [Gloeothece verrucosa]ADN17138.1 RNA methyltransferase, TrmA family [Gloeothece verrucosa PCC 7822]
MTKQGDLVEIEITDLSSSGDGVGRIEGWVVFVPDTVPGDLALVRLINFKKQYADGKLEQLIEASPHRIRPRCIVADKCGGCQWQHINPEYQRTAKSLMVTQTLQRIGGFCDPPVAPILGEGNRPELKPLEYRNKASYPLGISAQGTVKAGYYRRQTHHIVNLNQCPVQDPRLNPFLAKIKADIAERKWTIYQEKHHQGQLRHLSLRIGRRTGEILLTLVTTDVHLKGIEEQAQIWLKRYPGLVGVCLNYNPSKTNVIFGEQTQTVAGRPYLREIFAELEFELRPETFFQVNTEAAEALIDVIFDKLELQGTETLVDAYCGIGTFTLPLARRVKQAFGIELHSSSIIQAQKNAQINGLSNVSFMTGAVETLLPLVDMTPDLVLLDPPRKGCPPTVIDTLLKLKPPRIVYISCQVGTLARDLKQLCDKGSYHLTFVQPADFFPQTSHVECAAFLSQESLNMI